MKPDNPCGSASLGGQIASILGDYDMVSDDWGNRGESTYAPSFGDQGMSTEVAKFFNAAELMFHGVTFARPQSLPPFVPVGAESFHGSSRDYGVLSGFMYTQMHRPYQAETEFACDVANTPQGWVPLIVRELMASDADYYETNDSANGTDPTQPAIQPACYAMDFGIHYASCGNQVHQCDESSPCPSGSFCNPLSGCCQETPPSCSIAGLTTCNGTCVCDAPTNCGVAPTY